MPPLAKTLLPILFTTLIASCTAAPTLPELLVDIPPSVVPRDKEIPCSYSNGSDGLVSITKGKEHRILKVRYLSHGTRGCVYDVIEGLPELSPPAVVKTPRPDLYDDYLSPSEVDALHDLGQLILDGFDASGREWAVMKKAQGVLLWDHPEYQKKFPNGYNHMPDSLSDEQRLSAIQDCEHFMNFWYNLLINVFQEALLNHGWEYNDLNWENFRFTVSEPIKAEVIDWGDAVKVHEEDRKLRWALMEQTYLDELSSRESVTPVYDGTLFQETANVVSFGGDDHNKADHVTLNAPLGIGDSDSLQNSHIKRDR